MPLLIPEDLLGVQDRAREFFAWLPVKTRNAGWTVWTDCVEVWDWDRQKGWEMHFERLYAG